MDCCGTCGARTYPGTAYLTGAPLCESHYREAVALVEASGEVVRSKDDPAPDPGEAPVLRLKAA